MKIGIDLRKTSSLKKEFTQDFLSTLNEKKNLGIYLDDHIFPKDGMKISAQKFLSLWGGQIAFFQELQRQKYQYFITFEENYPFFYTKNVFFVLPSLESILYPEEKDMKFLQKYFTSFLLKRNLKKAKKIICFTQNSAQEINEKLNIPEEKIQIISPFFPKPIFGDSNINIASKYLLDGEYFIYDYNFTSNNNLKRLLETFSILQKRGNYYLFILGNQNSESREVREQVMKLGIQEKIKFIGTPDPKELKNYYLQSLGVIYPIIYDNFPITLSNAVHFGVPILASNTSEIESIFGENICYFSPNSVKSIGESIESFLEKPITPSYKEVLEKYRVENFSHNLFSQLQ